MTAEVVVFNTQGIALAADSAVTVGRARVWKHANKIFSAGPRNDIGIMIFNAGDFLGVPWEVVVKEHRRTTSGIVFDKLSDFSNHFVQFISSDKIRNEEQELQSFRLIIIDVLETLAKGATRLNQKEPHKAIPAQRERCGKMADLPHVPSSVEFSDAFKDDIKEFAQDILGIKLRGKLYDDVESLIYSFVCKDAESGYSTGVVIAGFGRNELFPVIENYTIDGKWKSFVRCWRDEDYTDVNSDSGNAGILPFAQKDMAILFVEGIYPKYFQFLNQVILGLMDSRSADLIKEYVSDPDSAKVEEARQRIENKKIVQSFFSEFSTYRQEEFVDHLIDTVSNLPKEEMAFMAKAIVELTALRRKFTSTVETVGGEIDVAIITKSDGFVWLNRKHYFSLDLNTDFSQRKSIAQERGNGSLDQPEPNASNKRKKSTRRGAAD